MATLTHQHAAQAQIAGRSRRPLIVGIVNVTPDSFSDGGRYLAPAAAVAHGLRLIADGADIVDVGAESTRPGSRPVPPELQRLRLEPVIRELAGRSVPISVDTRCAAVAEAALSWGASMVNDVSAGRHDPALLPLAARHGADVVLMHMQGEPEHMQDDPQYADCAGEVRDFLLARAAAAAASGIPPERIWIDPGIGFGKTVAHNLELLRALGGLTRTGFKVLVGASRKSFLAKLFAAQPQERLGGSLAALVPAFRAGVHAVRVHDVKATFQFLELLTRLEPA